MSPPTAFVRELAPFPHRTFISTTALHCSLCCGDLFGSRPCSLMKLAMSRCQFLNFPLVSLQSNCLGFCRLRMCFGNTDVESSVDCKVSSVFALTVWMMLCKSCTVMFKVEGGGGGGGGGGGVFCWRYCATTCCCCSGVNEE